MTDDTALPTDQTQPRKPYALWVLIFIFFVPMIVAYGYFFLGDQFSTGNHGELINPVVQVEQLHLKDQQGQNKLFEEAKWVMIFIADKDCDAVCNKNLYNMRQINIALGKNAHRFQHMVIHLEAMGPEFSQLVSAEHPNALHAYGSRDIISRTLLSSQESMDSNAIYIMDPLGNIMMRFASDVSPKLILKDLNRLLKISRIG